MQFINGTWVNTAAVRSTNKFFTRQENYSERAIRRMLKKIERKCKG